MTNDELDVLLITHCSVMLLFCFVLFLMAVFDSVFFSSQPGLGVDVKTTHTVFFLIFRVLFFACWGLTRTLGLSFNHAKSGGNLLVLSTAAFVAL